MFVLLNFQFKPANGPLETVFAPQRQATVITEVLEKELSLSPGAAFRGSVATVLGERNGTLRAELGMDPTAPSVGLQFEGFYAAAAKSGSTHDLVDLWKFNIPTLSEYGQGISPPLAFFMSRFLAHEGDQRGRHFAVPTRFNADVMRALGVRFVIVDREQSGPGFIERAQLAAGNVGRLFLYEMPGANLGAFSPTRIEPLPSAAQFADVVRQDPGILETVAFTDASVAPGLAPASHARMFFEKRGVRVEARSEGRSALLLPVQFSNCYEVKPLYGQAKAYRANLMHTLLVFEGDIHVRLRWRFSFWRGSACRVKDVRDMRALGLG